MLLYWLKKRDLLIKTNLEDSKMFKSGWILLVLVVLALGVVSCKSDGVAQVTQNTVVSSPNVVLDAYYTEDGELVIPNFKMTEGYDPSKRITEWKLRVGRIENHLVDPPIGYESPEISTPLPYSYKITEYVDGQEIK